MTTTVMQRTASDTATTVTMIATVTSARYEQYINDRKTSPTTSNDDRKTLMKQERTRPQQREDNRNTSMTTRKTLMTARKTLMTARKTSMMARKRRPQERDDRKTSTTARH